VITTVMSRDIADRMSQDIADTFVDLSGES